MQQKGRSMVEMLGVLAIIGVLSAGGLAGYSKAMYQHRLNKQAEQIGYILDNSAVLHSQGIDLSTVPYYAKTFFNSIGAIPKEMVKDDSYFIYDSFKNQVLLYRNRSCATCPHYFGLRVVIKKNAYDICINLYKQAVPRADFLMETLFVKSNENVSGQHTNYVTRNVLKTLTINRMQELCSVCDDASSCHFYFIWS